MIICDAKYLAELRRIEKEERRTISPDALAKIDDDLTRLWTDPETVRFRSPVAALAFNVSPGVIGMRINQNDAWGFQGNVPTDGRYALGTWFDWAGVNKDTRYFRTWQNPNDMIAAFKLAHAIIRYRGNRLQRALDRRSLTKCL